MSLLLGKRIYRDVTLLKTRIGWQAWAILKQAPHLPVVCVIKKATPFEAQSRDSMSRKETYHMRTTGRGVHSASLLRVRRCQRFDAPEGITMVLESYVPVDMPYIQSTTGANHAAVTLLLHHVA